MSFRYGESRTGNDENTRPDPDSEDGAMIRSLARLLTLCLVFGGLLVFELVHLSPRGIGYWLPNMTFVLTLFVGMYGHKQQVATLMAFLLILRLSFSVGGGASLFWVMIGLSTFIYQIRTHLFLGAASSLGLGVVGAIGTWGLYAIASRLGIDIPRGGDLTWIGVGLLGGVLVAPIIHGVLRGMLRFCVESDTGR